MSLRDTLRWLPGVALLAEWGCSARDASPLEQRFTADRERMVIEQIAGPGRGIRDEPVLAAMRAVPRHRFVPEQWRDAAYDDAPLPIGHNQTISQPFIVAFMSAQLGVRRGSRVLEIGTGSGYQAAVLAHMGAEVWSIEIVPELAERAQRTLAELGVNNVRVRSGDGYRGWPESAPFDHIIVTCSPEEIPQPLLDQLAEGGRMIIPVGDRTIQHLVIVEKRGGEILRRAVLPVRFVPMTGEAASGR